MQEEQTILDIAQYLKRLNKNIHALEDVTEIALKSENMTAAWTFLEALETRRCHYFWPLILHFIKKDGEIGRSNMYSNKRFDVYVFDESVS